MQKHITASCSIAGNVVYKDEHPVFSESGADLNAFLLNLYHHLGISYPKFYKMDNLSKLGWLATEVLLSGSFDKAGYKPDEVGVVITNANSSLDADVKYWDSVMDVASPSLFVYTLPNIVIGEICIRHGFKGEDALYITPQFDAAFITQQVNYLLDNGILKTCICGWADVVGQDYKATLFLIEAGEGAIAFSADEMKRIFDI